MTHDNTHQILRAKHVTRQFDSPEGPIPILQGVDFDLRRGRSAAIVGASGSGKTTLLSLLAGLDLPDSGSIWIGGEEITALGEDQRAAIRATRVGFIFQSFHLLQSLSALENTALPIELAGSPNAAPRAKELLMVLGLGQRLRHYPAQLSGGEQQRVAIARAFAGDPLLVFADEPTGNLDRKTASQVVELLFERQREQGVSLVLVTHDHELAGRCDSRYELVDGALTRFSARINDDAV